MSPSALRDAAAPRLPDDDTLFDAIAFRLMRERRRHKTPDAIEPARRDAHACCFDAARRLRDAASALLRHD